MTRYLFAGLLALIMGTSALLFYPDGQAIPSVEFKIIDGQRIHSADLQGKPVLINFWSTSCTPCIKEMPALEALHQANLGKLTMIGVAMPQDRPDIVIDFSHRLGITYPVALDLQGKLTSEFDIKVVPTTLLYGPDGQLTTKILGIVDTEALQTIIQQLTENRR